MLKPIVDIRVNPSSLVHSTFKGADTVSMWGLFFRMSEIMSTLETCGSYKGRQRACLFVPRNLLNSPESSNYYILPAHECLYICVFGTTVFIGVDH